jgi:hypothetical protein
MDRSFLSDARVIAASRNFVCVRLSTYESEEEARVLRTFFVGPSGQLENTVFAIVAPDGRTPLVRSGRSPAWAFRSADAMARGLDDIARGYLGPSSQGHPAVGGEMPYVKDLRLALDVAACDHLPLVVLYAPTSSAMAALERRALAVVWSPQAIGRAVYARALRAADLRPLGAAPRGACLLVVRPGRFGLDGVVTATLGENDLIRLPGALASASGGGDYARIFEHIQEGRQAGARWQTAIPVTDPGELRGGR